MIFLVAVAPTFVMFRGAGRLLRESLRIIRGWPELARNEPLAAAAFPTSNQGRGTGLPAPGLRGTFVLVAVVFNLLLVLTWGLLHGGAWSFFQARLLFAAFFSIAILLGVGLQALADASQHIALRLERSLLVLYTLFGLYYVVEIAYQVFLLATAGGPS